MTILNAKLQSLQNTIVSMTNDIQQQLTQMYVAKHNNKVVGYITVSMSHIDPKTTNKTKEKQINENIPVILIGHLAVHKDYERRGMEQSS